MPAEPTIVDNKNCPRHGVNYRIARRGRPETKMRQGQRVTVQKMAEVCRLCGKVSKTWEEVQ